jgi:cytochrome c
MHRSAGIICGIMIMLASSAPTRAAGDAQAGEAVFKKSCAVCHAVEAGKNKVGPSLHGVVGRHFAALPDFRYSDALKKTDKTWDDQMLDAYLASPKGLVPGTSMVFVGLKGQEDRQNVIAYLKSQN